MAFIVVALAIGYLGLAVFAPTLLLAALPVAMGAGCALAAGRRSRRRGAALFTVWLAIGLAGAWWWRSHPATGLGWVIGTLFLLPLPIVPWLYAAWFGERS
ncbi:MAG TPA: hypothetical protein PLP31_09950 [Thermoanaerobaculaceae bacterium]|nr:hypothetical protein [Thermoanaerobaculaceae bacterium]